MFPYITLMCHKALSHSSTAVYDGRKGMGSNPRPLNCKASSQHGYYYSTISQPMLQCFQSTIVSLARIRQFGKNESSCLSNAIIQHQLCLAIKSYLRRGLRQNEIFMQTKWGSYYQRLILVQYSLKKWEFLSKLTILAEIYITIRRLGLAHRGLAFTIFQVFRV